MKKRFVAIGLAVLVVISVVAVILAKKNSDSKNPQTTTVAFQNAQLGVTVDGWLKIIEIDEYYGKLAVIAENVSDSDVEYALLTVKTKSGSIWKTTAFPLPQRLPPGSWISSLAGRKKLSGSSRF